MPDSVLPLTPASVWANQVTRELRSLQNGASKDVLTLRSAIGTTVADKRINTFAPTAIPTKYDYDEAYGVGDYVYVTQAEVPFWSANEIIKGVWCCVQNVPTNKFPNDPTVPGRDPSKAVNYYYPKWPMPAMSSDPTEASDRFWLLIGMYPEEMTICQDNTSKEYWIAASEKSGSA